MIHDDYTRQTPGRFVTPDDNVGISLFEPEPPVIYGSPEDIGPGGVRYRTPCDAALGAEIQAGRMHPRNWSLFQTPSGQWAQSCGGGSRGLSPAHPMGPAVPAWGNRVGVYSPSAGPPVLASGYGGMREGFASPAHYRPGDYVPPWVSAYRNPTSAANPYYGALPGGQPMIHPALWPSPGSSEAMARDPRPDFYGVPSPSGGTPPHHGTTVPLLHRGHAIKHVPPCDASCKGGGEGCGCGLSSLFSPRVLVIIIVVLLVLWACALGSGSGSVPVFFAATGSAPSAPSAGATAKTQTA